MRSDRDSPRAVTPLIGTVLLVVVVVGLSATVGAGMYSSFGDLDDRPPNVVIEPSAEDETVIFRHAGGDRITGDRLALSGVEEESGTIPDRVTAGSTITATATATEVDLVWSSGSSSHVLATADVDSAVLEEPSAGPEPAAPGENDAIHVSGSNGGVNADNEPVVVGAGSSITGYLNNPGDVFVMDGATIATNVHTHGNTVVVRSGGTIEGDVSAASIYMLPGATVHGNVNLNGGTVYLHDASQIKGNINNGTVVIAYE